MDSTGMICIVGGGPAGLMAADVASDGGVQVVLCDAMPSVGRKFLLAGRGGLNLTHSEPLPAFTERYGAHADLFAGLLAEFGPTELRAWAAELGIETFVGTSGRVFPAEFKAAPLLRAWVRRLRERNVQIRQRHRWTAISADGSLTFATPGGDVVIRPDAAILALGGGSWPQLGSDGAWVKTLADLGCRIEALRPANCGFDVAWSDHMASHFGTPLKAVAFSHGGVRRRGEAVLTHYGIEGGAIYALAAGLRSAIERDGRAVLLLDAKPDLSEDDLCRRLREPRGRLSLSSWLRKAVNLPPVIVALLREVCAAEDIQSPQGIARSLKALPLVLAAPRPLAEAISTAGGVSFTEVDEQLMIRRRPGLFAAGEMLDWEAPTGGYLLTGCIALGRRAAKGALAWLANRGPELQAPHPSRVVVDG